MVKLLNPKNLEEVEKWETFNREKGYLWHSAKWISVLHKTYGFKPFYLYEEEKGEITSIFPLFHVKGLLGLKDEFVSIPHVETGGVINSDRFSNYLDFLSSNREIKKLRIYQFKDKLDSYPSNDINSIFFIDIPKTQDELIKFFKKKKKRSLRKIENKDFPVNWGFSQENLEKFFYLLRKRMKELGTPWHKKEFYINTFLTFRENLLFLLMEQNNTPVGVSIAVIYGKVCYSLYHLVPRKYQRYGISLSLYYYLMRKARSEGAEVFCFGRSKKGTGPYELKKSFGAVEYPIHIYSFRKKNNSFIPEYSKFVSQKYAWVSNIIRELPIKVLEPISGSIRKWVY